MSSCIAASEFEAAKLPWRERQLNAVKVKGK
jgi:hypothetical protein